MRTIKHLFSRLTSIAAFICISFLFTALPFRSNAHEITFCGEPVPVDKDFVAQKLMDVIKRQIPYVNMSSLKQKANRYFPFIEDYLKRAGIPEDFKYIPIVESGFANLSSNAGASGFWQLMPADARDFNLRVTPEVDDREDPEKSTGAACKLIMRNYRTINNSVGITSWILTAAAYNFGVGSIIRTSKKQGNDYFTMALNAETAEYVYKIIAIKELFENPELYMNGFGTNIFKAAPVAGKQPPVAANAAKPATEFASMNLTISKSPVKKVQEKPQVSFVTARLSAPKKNFKDGDLVSVELSNDLNLPGKFVKQGTIIKGTGWMIGERVFVNLGYGHQVQVMDGLGQKGIPADDINKDNKFIILKTEIYND